MTNRVQAKQIEKALTGVVGVGNLNIPNLNIMDVTPSIVSVLATAGEHKGLPTSVPVTTATASNVVGIWITAPWNKVEIYDSLTLQKIDDDAGNEVYGRITEPSVGQYDLSFFSLMAGVEVAYTMNQNVDFEFAYNFDFRTFPSYAVAGLKTKRVYDDINNGMGRKVIELIPVTALNTLGNLTFTPTAVVTILNVNGVEEFEEGVGVGSFSRAGLALTWDSLMAGYDLETDDTVWAKYYTHQ